MASIRDHETGGHKRIHKHTDINTSAVDQPSVYGIPKTSILTSIKDFGRAMTRLIPFLPSPPDPKSTRSHDFDATSLK